ncbi:hypothetical protein [Rhodosalinus sp.]|uniref:hypothetical protein n=1 Tax=Rhodosalinus sp. TaxID=2047741 RepID=UPI00397A4907
MSNSVTQSELEDVLAAIRRLVAEDRTSPAEPSRGSGHAGARDKLVLTPALRVHDRPSPDGAERASAVPDTGAERPVDPERQGGGGTSQPEGQARGTDPVDTATEEAAPARALNRPGEKDALPNGARHVSDAGAAGDARPAAEGPEQAEARAAQMSPDTTPDPAAPRDGVEPAEPGRDPQARRMSDAEPLPLEATSWPQAAEAPHPPVADAAGGDAGSEAAFPDAAMESAGPRQPENGAEAAADVTGRTVSLENKIAELEAMIGMHGGWEADEGDEPPFTATSGPEAEDDESAAHPGERSDAASEPETAVLDEEMLRDLVAGIVRQELQGELGERITRNVRKLVRREIHRALTAQLFD